VHCVIVEGEDNKYLIKPEIEYDSSENGVVADPREEGLLSEPQNNRDLVRPPERRGPRPQTQQGKSDYMIESFASYCLPMNNEIRLWGSWA